MKQKFALVLGAGGFIGSHMATRLRNEGYIVRGVDLKRPEFSSSDCHEFQVADLRDPKKCSLAFFIDGKTHFDEVYQFAADMGGAGYIFTGEHDADVMHNSCMVNLNVAEAAVKNKVGKLFYSSSACIYPYKIQEDPNSPGLRETDAYPVEPDSEYGYEKIFSERLYDSYRRNYGLNIRVARFHNIFGPNSTYQGGKEKSPAALCRKVAMANDGDQIEVWGTGEQTRSFLYIDECIEGVRRLMRSECFVPVNIGSDERISINSLAKMIIGISGKPVWLKNIESNAIGVQGRNSNNDFIFQQIGWKPNAPLRNGMEKLYTWINQEKENGNIQ